MRRPETTTPSGRLTLLMAPLLVLAILLPATRCAGAGDPWYEDVPSQFWAYREIRVLWEEECADGWVRSLWRWNRWGSWEWKVATFRPNDPATRGQFALLMAKTFRLDPEETRGPTFADVPRGFCLYGDKPAYGYIEALAASGQIGGSGDGRFRPHDSIERQHAVAVLVRALGLSGFAQLLARDSRRYLNRFPDGYLVDPSVAAEMAAAVRLGIIIGYDDGSLRPRENLRRCQAAALLVRSALVDVTAHPPRLSPDGDAVEDTVTFAFRTLKNRSTRAWSLSIGNLEGQWYRRFSPQGQAGEPPSGLVWDGSDDAGQGLPDGTYFYRAWITDSRGERFWSALKPLTLERRRLWGNLHPGEVGPGDNIAVEAHTTGGASSVTAYVDGAAMPLSPSSPPGSTGTNTWRAALSVPDGCEEGSRPVRLLASFPGTTRTLDLSYYVRDPLTVSGTLDPNPARAGERVSVLASTTANASEVTAALPWGEQIVLKPGPPGRWQGTFRTRPDTPDGTYPVLLAARAGSRQRQQPLQLLILGSALEDLLVTLSE